MQSDPSAPAVYRNRPRLASKRLQWPASDIWPMLMIVAAGGRRRALAPWLVLGDNA